MNIQSKPTGRLFGRRLLKDAAYLVQDAKTKCPVQEYDCFERYCNTRRVIIIYEDTAYPVWMRYPPVICLVSAGDQDESAIVRIHKFNWYLWRQVVFLKGWFIRLGLWWRRIYRQGAKLVATGGQEIILRNRFLDRFGIWEADFNKYRVDMRKNLSSVCQNYCCYSGWIWKEKIWGEFQFVQYMLFSAPHANGNKTLQCTGLQWVTDHEMKQFLFEDCLFMERIIEHTKMVGNDWLCSIKGMKIMKREVFAVLYSHLASAGRGHLYTTFKVVYKGIIFKYSTGSEYRISIFWYAALAVKVDPYKQGSQTRRLFRIWNHFRLLNVLKEMDNVFIEIWGAIWMYMMYNMFQRKASSFRNLVQGKDDSNETQVIFITKTLAG